MLLKNISALIGPNLEYLPLTNIAIHKDKFKQINASSRSTDKKIDCEGLLLIPGLINSHIHIGDSIAKDVAINNSINDKIHPVFGLKRKILQTTNPNTLVRFMRLSCNSMLRKGITTFIDFREGGIDGVHLLRKALFKLPIRSIILGRLDYYHTSKQIKKNQKFPLEKQTELDALLHSCDGLGISGANEHSDSMLKFYSKTNKIRAIHAAETKESVLKSRRLTKKSEVRRALELKPHFVVHMTHASRQDLILTAKKTSGIVVCPRANASLAEGIPDVDMMQRCGCNVAIGTDNVMINSVDMFREMDYLWKVTMAVHKKRIDPVQILKMATVNAGKILHKPIGRIESNFLADAIFINKHGLDLEPLHNPHAAIVHRVSESDIRAVMIGGKIVYGKI